MVDDAIKLGVRHGAINFALNGMFAGHLATVDMDPTIAETDGACKGGIDPTKKQSAGDCFRTLNPLA